MKIYKPKFWDENIGIFALILLPLSIIFTIIIFLKKKFTRGQKFKVPVICVGNIYIGGTGKTPTSIFIAKKLTTLGKNPAIIRKDYKNHSDEHNLIRKHYSELIINKSRSIAISQAETKNYDSVILDDGFQDYKIKKNLNILCFNKNQLIGNGLIFPSGPLRESLSAIKNAHIVIINGKKSLSFEEKVLKINKKIHIFYSKFEPLNLDEFLGKNIFAIAGIGNPNNFFELLSEKGLKIKKKMSFPDHYKPNKSEILKIINEADKNNLQIIMTEKDYLRDKYYEYKKINYLKVKLIIENELDLIKKISKVYD